MSPGTPTAVTPATTRVSYTVWGPDNLANELMELPSVSRQLYGLCQVHSSQVGDVIKPLASLPPCRRTPGVPGPDA